MNCIIEKLPNPEQCGDWHDKSLRWSVRTGTELQKFATRADAAHYASIRRRAATEAEAFRNFADTDASKSLKVAPAEIKLLLEAMNSLALVRFASNRTLNCSGTKNSDITSMREKLNRLCV
jgi:hypothetical protein